MNTRRANLARNILALGAMFGGMPVGLGVPHRSGRPEPHPEARRLAVDLGVTYDEAELAFLRFGEARARELIGICHRHGQRITHDVIDFIDRNSPRPDPGDLMALIERGAALPKSYEVAPYRPVHGTRSLAEKKARRAKRKQRRQR